jgi:hypothetical protein
MWIFTNQAMLSIVQKPGDIDMLTVRARVKGDIQRVFPGTKVQTGGGTDYAYRAKVPRAAVAKVIHDQIMATNYDNFKNSITDDDHHNLCAAVWHVSYRHQQYMAPKPRGRQKNLIG